jgi:ATPase related to the helicase subunit of the Holliday junction resolvase
MMLKKPKMRDNREVPLPEGYTHLAKQGVKALKFGHTLWLEGAGYSTRAVQEILEKINSQQNICIVCTGTPGVGKTYFAMRFAQKLDSDFNIIDTPSSPGEDPSQLVFSRDHLAYLTGPNTPLKRGQVVIVDESHFNIGARSWQDKKQQSLVNYLSSIRSKGLILIIVVLHTRMIDSILRDFMINYEFHVTKRGLATIYRRWYPVNATEPYRKKLGKMKLQLPDEALCNWLTCLDCEYLKKPVGKRCMTLRAIYERRKEQFLDEKGKQREDEVKNGVDDDTLIETFYNNREMITPTRLHTPDPASLKIIAKLKCDANVGRHRLALLSKELVLRHPDVLELLA